MARARKVPSSTIAPGHADYFILAALQNEVIKRVPSRLDDELAERALQAVEFVLDPIRTGRTRLVELDNVEKTFVGLKIEHFIRDLLDAPKGVRDLQLAGHDVDIKNTIGRSWCWMIPPETFRSEEPCLLIASDEEARKSWMGLIIARQSYLGKPNRDGKRRVYASAFANILWLAAGVDWAADRWAGIDMARFRELRDLRGGSKRAATFFSENLRKPIHRNVVSALLWEQKDAPKRLRSNGGAKDILKGQKIALMSGNYFNGTLDALGLSAIGRDEFIAVDVQNKTEETILKSAGQL